MKLKNNPSTVGLARVALGALALAFSATVATPGNSEAAGTTASASIKNVVKVEYLDANGKGLNGGAQPIAKSAWTEVTVTLLAAAPSIGAPSPAPVQTVESGAAQTYVFKVWSNANGEDNYTFDVSLLTNTDITSSDRYISAVTNAQNVTTPSGSGTTSVTFDLGAVTIISNTANTVDIPFGTKVPNGITDGDLIVINGAEYKVVGIANAGNASAYNGATNSLTPEVPTTLTISTVAGGNPGFGVNALTGLPLSQEYAVTVTVTATADPNQPKGTSCFDDTFKSTATPLMTTSVLNSCTDFKSSNLAIAKNADIPSGKPGDVVTYTVTVSLPATAAASTKVKVTDAVPVYTTLNSNTYGAGTFAQVRKSADGGGSYGAWVSLTNAGDNTEDGATASGDAAGTVANSALTFYLGNGNVGTGAPTGGTVNPNEVFQVEYKVTIN